MALGKRMTAGPMDYWTVESFLKSFLDYIFFHLGVDLSLEGVKVGSERER